MSIIAPEGVGEARWTLAAAGPQDLDEICALLASSGLPAEGVADHLDGVLVVRDAGRLVATAGLEDYGDAGLLRSVAVAPTHRGRGLGRALVAALLARARARGHAEVYLLTTTAAGYFARLGFRPTTREAVRPSVQRSAEWHLACCASSVVMVRPLGETSPGGEVTGK
ncbi:MAG: arsenic resistance N-acetyltransferase ArsN2 [Armatimonadota bacterium]|nr:arsenic resistance N-acetyltransferase ArsN2 [Armatimonadota bacterium]